MQYKVIDSNIIQNKNIVLRLDLNVPMQNTKIVSDIKIQSSLNTINFLLKNANKITILSHFKNPKNQDKNLSLIKIVQYLSKLMLIKVPLITSIEPNHLDSFDKICVLENTRFFQGEYENCSKLGKEFAGLGDIFVQDAFACSHRNHASMNSITNFIPSYMGLNLSKEISVLNKLQANITGKFALAIIGGAKIETKTKLVKTLLKNGYKVFAAGKIGNYISNNLNMFQHESLYLPVDGLNADNKYGVWVNYHDIGQKSLIILKNLIKKADYLVWNGPLGQFEKPEFSNGTKALINLIKENKAYSVAGGGETLSVVKPGTFNHICCAGGAFIAYLSNKNLPGIKNLLTS
jgi:phosphoglycerate kinase